VAVTRKSLAFSAFWSFEQPPASGHGLCGVRDHRVFVNAGPPARPSSLSCAAAPSTGLVLSENSIRLGFAL
jgi:hypothetical protein